MNNDLKRLFLVGFLITVLVASVYGANRWFRRGCSCANGQCSVVDVVPEPTPVVIPTPAPMPDNIVLDNTKVKNKTQEGPSVGNDVLGPPDICDCFASKCICKSKKDCTCISCNCEACPVKTKPVVSSPTPTPKKEDSSISTLPVVDNGLDVNWAINQMKLGYKVRKKTFPEDVYFYMVGNIVYSNRATNPQLYFSKDDKDTNWENYLQQSANQQYQDDCDEQYDYQPRGGFFRRLFRR